MKILELQSRLYSLLWTEQEVWRPIGGKLTSDGRINVHRRLTIIKQKSACYQRKCVYSLEATGWLLLRLRSRGTVYIYSDRRAVVTAARDDELKSTYWLMFPRGCKNWRQPGHRMNKKIFANKIRFFANFRCFFAKWGLFFAKWGLLFASLYVCKSPAVLLNLGHPIAPLHLSAQFKIAVSL